MGGLLGTMIRTIREKVKARKAIVVAVAICVTSGCATVEQKRVAAAAPPDDRPLAEQIVDFLSAFKVNEPCTFQWVP